MKMTRAKKYIRRAREAFDNQAFGFAAQNAENALTIAQPMTKRPHPRISRAIAWANLASEAREIISKCNDLKARVPALAPHEPVEGA